ncbi:uncharacterized protein [Procambarus clarkii]|uniref:uncharacterized protein isoform X5 n=1 Tax=Procambarus clarkii TaxID=6728 RepID=UPI0037431440
MTWNGHGASIAVLKMMYTAYVRSIIDYAAPVLCTYSQSDMKRLESIQNEAMTIILGVPRTAKTSNLREELSLPSVKSRIQELNAKLAIRIARDPHYNGIAKKKLSSVLLSGGNRRSKKWHHRSVCYLEELHLLEQARELLPVERLPPWEDDSCKIIINEMATQKSNMIPQEMRHKYLEEIYEEAGDELDQIYTDGYSNPVSNRAGAAYMVIKDNTFQCRNEEKARIENYASSTQAELTAIVMALRFLERNTNGAVICTDSKAALQSLSKNRAENLAIVAEIKRAVRVLTNQGRVIKFLWIPFHVGICGNERADVLAAEGAEGDHIEFFIPKTLLQIRGIVRQRHRDKVTEERRMEAQTSESIRWYNMVAAGNPNHYGRRGGGRGRESVIARIRLGYKYP